jgi:hypothetical protein
MPNNLSNTNNSSKKLITVAEVYLYLDGLFEQDTDSDTLFAGGYLRGFISLVATEYGEESQAISAELIEGVSDKLRQAKAELTPQDHAIVANFWLITQKRMMS